VAQLKAGQVDMIVRVPAADVPTLKRDSKLNIVTGDTIYVFNVELDQREKSPQVSGKDGAVLPNNPLRDPRVREAMSLAIDRPALVEGRAGGARKARHAERDAGHFRLRQ
jgi:peptide/nickel transport system substrate-binding protein